MRSLAIVNRNCLDLVDAELDEPETSVANMAVDQVGEELLL